MSATNATETAALQAILHTGGTLYLSLHTADPGDTGSQTSSEAAYTGYSRVSIGGNSTDLPISGTSPTAATNAATLTFSKCTASPGSAITHVGIGTDSSGAGTLKLSLALSSSLTMAAGVTPLFEAGGLQITCD